jgi:hypothetical protein
LTAYAKSGNRSTTYRALSDMGRAMQFCRSDLSLPA